jgi:hypothetical protein
MLVSPPVTFFPPITAFSSKSFKQGVRDAMSRKGRVCVIYGTSDGFTGVGRYHSFISETKVEGMEVEDGDHFYTSESASRGLQRNLESWLK